MRTLMRLRDKKGFTLVELVVVIGMIAVLAAIIFPMFSNSGKSQEASAKAKSFYFGVQKVIVQYRSESPEKDSEFISYAKDGATVTIGDGDYLYLTAKAEAGKGFTEIRLSELPAPDDGSPANTAQGYKALQTFAIIDPTSADHSLLDNLNTFSTDDDYGYYYALIDDKCRVAMTYWTGYNEIADLSRSTPGSSAYSKVTVEVTDDYYVDEYVIGAYPLRYAFEESKLFDKIDLPEDDTSEETSSEEAAPDPEETP